jgi:hypothetical protein
LLKQLLNLRIVNLSCFESIEQSNLNANSLSADRQNTPAEEIIGNEQSYRYWYMEISNEKKHRDIYNLICINGSGVYDDSKRGGVRRQPATGNQVAVSSQRVGEGDPRAAATLGVDVTKWRILVTCRSHALSPAR